MSDKEKFSLTKFSKISSPKEIFASYSYSDDKLKLIIGFLSLIVICSTAIIVTLIITNKPSEVATNDIPLSVTRIPPPEEIKKQIVSVIHSYTQMEGDLVSNELLERHNEYVSNRRSTTVGSWWQKLKNSIWNFFFHIELDIYFNSRVLYGIDLRKLGVNSITVENDQVKVFLPDAEIISIEYDINNINANSGWFVFDAESGYFTSDSIGTVKGRIRTKAQNNDRELFKAKENAKHIMQQFLEKRIDIKEVNIHMMWIYCIKSENRL